MSKFCETNAVSNNSFIGSDFWRDTNLEIYALSYKGAWSNVKKTQNSDMSSKL